MQVNREPKANLDSGWRYTTARDHINPSSEGPEVDQQTQTVLLLPLRVKDAGAQYSSPSDSSDSNSSDSDADIEGTENITVAKRYLNRHSLSSEDLYTAPACLNKCFRTSTPEPCE